MQKKTLGKLLFQITNGVVGTVIDLVLYQTYLLYTIGGKHTQYEINKAFEEAGQMLEECNYKLLSRALSNAIQKGFIKRIHQGEHAYEITKLGKQRIAEMFPTYKEKRPWDGYLYLVSYDIPRTSNTKRDLLREYLRRIGCGKLQDSLWMTPYNPTGIVDEFVNDHQVPGTILVSKLGKDGNIGQKDQKTLISQVYHYDTLIDRYNEFIKTYQKNQNPNKTQLSMDYYTILNDDPQLPFSLEPDDFPAREAHVLFHKLIRA